METQTDIVSLTCAEKNLNKWIKTKIKSDIDIFAHRHSVQHNAIWDIDIDCLGDIHCYMFHIQKHFEEIKSLDLIIFLMEYLIPILDKWMIKSVSFGSSKIIAYKSKVYCLSADTDLRYAFIDWHLIDVKNSKGLYDFTDKKHSQVSINLKATIDNIQYKNNVKNL